MTESAPVATGADWQDQPEGYGPVVTEPVEQPRQRRPLDPRLILTFSLVGLAALLVVMVTVLLLADKEATMLIIVLATVIGGLFGLFVAGPGRD